jgi:hypothetical protein
MEHSTDDYWRAVRYSHWPDSELILASIAEHRSGGRGFNMATKVHRPLMRALCKRLSSVEDCKMVGGVVVGKKALDEKSRQRLFFTTSCGASVFLYHCISAD